MATSVFTTGAAGDGKTTLVAAIRYCLAAAYPKLNPPESTGMNPTGVAHESFATPTTHFVVLDAPASTRDAALSALPKMDIALLVVSTDEGPQQTTIDAIEHARAIGVPNIVVYLSKTDIDEDEELYELLELQTRELLSHHGGYDGDAAAILWGSAKEALRSSGSPADPKAASIFALVDAIERAARV